MFAIGNIDQQRKRRCHPEQCENILTVGELGVTRWARWLESRLDFMLGHVAVMLVRSCYGPAMVVLVAAESSHSTRFYA